MIMLEEENLNKNRRKSIFEALIDAKKNGYAIPHFNIESLIWARAILEECISRRSPVIIALTSTGAELFGGIRVAGGILNSLFNTICNNRNVYLHLDHEPEENNIIESLESGFDSVLFDVSPLDLDSNEKITCIKETLERLLKKFPNSFIELEANHIKGSISKY